MLTSEGLALLRDVEREGVLTVARASPEDALAERLEGEGLVRRAGPAGGAAGRRYVLSGRGVRLIRNGGALVSTR